MAVGRTSHAALVAAALVVVLVPAQAAVMNQAAVTKLKVGTASGMHEFKVELACTEPEREKGLMYRRSMPKDHGMLFEYETEQPVTFWMKNTYIPLDLIFINRAGHVVSIKHDAKPMDESLIPSGAPAVDVLELNAGVSRAIGLEVGDEIPRPVSCAKG